MKIAGLLSWYDESPAWLAAAVAGMGRICDEIVAVDGAYALYPAGRPRSHPQQAEAVLHAAEALGIGCTLYRPRDVFWGNEVEKRNLTLSLAAPHLEAGSDWILVFDGDWLVVEASPEIVRHELERTELEMALFTIVETVDFMANPTTDEYAREHELESSWSGQTGPIFRWDPTLRYGPSHFVLSRERDGEREWVAGPNGVHVDAHELGRSLVVHHRSQDRSFVRRRSASDYYKARDLHGVEELGEDPLAAVASR